jgi:hypothetical protein
VAKVGAKPGQGEKITDWEKFRAFAINNTDKTQAEMALAWGGVSQRTISRGLKKIGFTRKKNLRLPATRCSEAGRLPQASA